MVNLMLVSPNLRFQSLSSGVLLYHRLYGYPKVVSPEVASKAISLRDSKVPFSFSTDVGLSMLDNSGLIIESGSDENLGLEEIIQRRFENASSGKYVRSLQLNVSELCNLACTYCIQSRSGDGENLVAENSKQIRKLMPWGVAKESVDKFIRLLDKNDNHRGHVMFFGGEPLMNWSLIERVMDYIHDEYRDFNISFVSTSNATLINERVAEKMAQHSLIFQASLDGLKDVNDVNRVFVNGSGTFDKINSGLELLSRYGVNINLGTVITDSSIENLSTDFIDYAKSLGVNSIEVNPEETLYKTVRKQEITERLFELIKYGISSEVNVFSLLENPLLNLIYQREGACSAAGTTFSVEPSGEVYLCRCLSQPVGDMENFEEILRSDYFTKMATKVEGNISNCQGCDLEGLCSGGCSANAEKLNGDVFSNDVTRCYMAKTLFDLELSEIGLREPSKQAINFIEGFGDASEYDVERALIRTSFNFWDKEIIRRDLGVVSEREYVPVRMIDY